MSLLESTRNTRAILPDSLRFLRSDVPVALTDRDREWLLENNVTTAVDLREESERRQKPCCLERDGAFRYLRLPVTGGNVVPASPDEVAGTYLAMADEQMERIVETILHAETNVLFFCNAGKDRTGVVSALLLSRLGRGRQEIVDDYLLSGEMLRDELWTYAEAHPDVDLAVITPRAAYMEEFLDRYRNAPERRE